MRGAPPFVASSQARRSLYSPSFYADAHSLFWWTDVHCCRPWSKDSWINFLKDKHGKLEDHFERKPAQPNPWRAEGVDTTSKRYYINLMQVFEGTSAASPTRIVEDACRKVVEFMGGDDVAEFRQGHDLHYMYIYVHKLWSV